MRVQFDLPEGDFAYLVARGFLWEAIIEAGARWLLVHNFPVAEGFSQHPTAAAAFQITNGYPDAPLDMVYFHPCLTRRDGKGIPATEARQALDGKAWQRWSRHRTAANAWRPGVDDLATHIQLIEDCLERELRRA